MATLLWEGDASGSLTINERIVDDCPSGAAITTISDLNDFDVLVRLTIDHVAGTYEIAFAGGVGIRVVTPGGTFGGGILWGPTFVGPLPATGTRLTGTATVRPSEVAPITIVAGDPFSSELQVQYGWDIRGDEMEVVVEPIARNYWDWLPTGNVRDPQKPGGAPIAIRARLQKKGGGPITSKAQKFKFELSEVSAVPGVTMNWPLSAGSEPDLRFISDFNPAPNWSVETDGKVAVYAPDRGASQATVKLSCFDFGAFGRLKVTATVEGEELVGSVLTPEGKKQELLIPYRTEQSRIAKAWLKGQESNDSADEDAQPTGDGHKGDGFSLYEEYRGFRVNAKHIRTDPVGKNLFVHTVSQALFRKGINYFAQQSGLKVYSQLSPEEFAADRVMNRNHIPETHNVDQHGLLLVSNRALGGVAYSPGTLPGPSTPATTIACEIGAVPKVMRGHTLYGQKLTSTVPFFVSTVAHELAHGCSVWHHGEACNSGGVTWRAVPLAAGGTRLDEVGCTAFFGIRVLNESGAEITDKIIATLMKLPDMRDTNVAVGTSHQLFSGNELCAMRYVSVASYERSTSNIRHLPLNQNYGGIFCESPTATGTARPYGDATPGRGACKFQFCVNDIYATDPLHQR